MRRRAAAGVVVLFSRPPLETMTWQGGGLISRGYERNNLFIFSTFWGYFLYFIFFYIFLHTPKSDILFIFPAGHPEKGYLFIFRLDFPADIFYIFYISFIYLRRPNGPVWGLAQFHGLRGGYFIHFPSAASRQYVYIFYIFISFWPPRKDVFQIF